MSEINITDYVTAIQKMAEDVRKTAVAPLDQIRLLCRLAEFGREPAPASLGMATKVETDSRLAVEALCRRAALVSMARAIADYIPSSSNEAKAILARVMPLYDAEILNAGDLGDYQTYNDLRSLRATIAHDMKNRAIRLPEIVRVSRSKSQPSLVLAHALYEDATRADELVQRVDPPHPLFFPVAFDALSA
jgi:prophage DNA circulation protein